jgi:hypothetical protein
VTALLGSACTHTQQTLREESKKKSKKERESRQRKLQRMSGLLSLMMLMLLSIRAATAGKAPKAWALPRFWVSIGSYKKQLAKKIWG